MPCEDGAGREHVLALATGSELDVDGPCRSGARGASAAPTARARRCAARPSSSRRGRESSRAPASRSCQLGGVLAARAAPRHREPRPDARIWNVADRRARRVFQHNTEVRDAPFSPDGRWLVTGGASASLWDASTARSSLRLKGHEGVVTACAFDPSGRIDRHGGEDGTVRVVRCDICGASTSSSALPTRGSQQRDASSRREERELYLGG